MFNNKSLRLEERRSFSVHSNTSYIERRWRLGDDDDVGVVTQEVSTLELIRHVGREKELQGVTHVVNSIKIGWCCLPSSQRGCVSFERWSPSPTTPRYFAAAETTTTNERWRDTAVLEREKSTWEDFCAIVAISTSFCRICFFLCTSSWPAKKSEMRHTRKKTVKHENMKKLFAYFAHSLTCILRCFRFWIFSTKCWSQINPGRRSIRLTTDWCGHTVCLFRQRRNHKFPLGSAAKN